MGTSSVGQWEKHFKYRDTDVASHSHSCCPQTAWAEREEKSMRSSQRISVWQTEMAAGIGLGYHVVQEVMGSFGYCWIPCLLMAAQTSAKKMFPKICWDSMLLKVVTFFAASWRVMKTSFITLIQKWNSEVWNGITQHCARRRGQKQCCHSVRPWELYWGMHTGWVFAMREEHWCCSLPAYAAEAFSCRAWQMSKEGKAYPQT